MKIKERALSGEKMSKLSHTQVIRVRLFTKHNTNTIGYLAIRYELRFYEKTCK